MEKYFESNFALLYWRNETKRVVCCMAICDETAEEDKTGRFQDVFLKKSGSS
jgi:hypothetical protein